MTVIGIGRLDLMDLSDAIISGSMPASTQEGQLWIDTSKETPVLMVYQNGNWIVQHLDVFQMDENLAYEVTTIIDTLGSITNDDRINYNDRVILSNELNRIIGKITSTKSIDNYLNGLPTLEELELSGLGSLAMARKSAKKLGIDIHDDVFLNTEIEYNALKDYLENLNKDNVNAWDITTNNSAVVIDIEGDEFRAKWLAYYNAILLLEGEILSVPGPAGLPSVSMILTNDSITVATDNDGNNGDYSLAFTNVMIYEGTAEVTDSWVITVSKPDYIEGNFTNNRFKIDNILQEEIDNSYVEFTAKREGYTDIRKRLTISKTKTGQSAISEWLTISSPVMNRDAGGIYTPTTLSFSAKRRIGRGNILPLKGKFKVYESTGGNHLLVYDSDITEEDTHTHTPTQSGIKYITVEFYKDDEVLVDSQTIIVVSDGMDAKIPVTLTVDNDTIVIPSNPDGELYDFSLDYAEVTVTAYLGNEYINLTLPTSQYNLYFIPEQGIEGLQYIRSESNRISYKITNILVDQGTVEVVLTDKDGLQIASRRVTVSKNRDGKTGADGKYEWISVPKVIAINLDEYNNASYTPSTFNVSSYKIVGDSIRVIDPDVPNLRVEAENIHSGALTTLLTVENGSQLVTTNILNMIGSEVDFRYYRIKVSVERGTATESEYIEIISDGIIGRSEYMWIRYSNNEDGSDMDTDPADMEYIGIAVTSTPTPPESHTSYNWMKFRGTDGIPGMDGMNLHIKYSNDGGHTFTVNSEGIADGETVGTYIGMYIDRLIKDSTDPSKYKWNRQTGESNIIGLVTNESMTFPADAKGVVTSYLSNSGKFEVYKGIDKLAPEHIIYSIVENSIINVTVSINSQGEYIITSITDGRNITSGTVTLEAKIEDTVIHKVISITKSLAGEAGINAVTGNLSNTNMVFPSDMNGNVLSYGGNTGLFSVFDGTTNVNDQCIFSSTGSNVSVDIDEHGSYKVSNMDNGLNVMSGKVILKAIYKNNTIEKEINITKSPAGIDAMSYWLTSSNEVIIKDMNNEIHPKTMTFSIQSQIGMEPFQPYNGRFKVEVSNDGENFTGVNNFNPTPTDQSSIEFTIPDNIKVIKVSAFRAGGTSELIDIKSIPIYQEVRNGYDAVIGHLSNENHTIHIIDEDDSGNYYGASTQFRIYEGTRDITSEWNITYEADDGIQGSFNTNTYTYTVSNMTIGSGQVTFTASRSDSYNIIKTFSINKNIQAKDGISPTVYMIETDTIYLYKNNESGEVTPATINIKGKHSIEDLSPVLTDGYFVIYEQNEDQTYLKKYQSTKLEDNITYSPSSNINKIDIEWYRDKDLTDLLDAEEIPVITDGKDSYRVEVMSTNGNVFKNGIIDTWIYAVVYKGNIDITSEISDTRFKWTRISDDAIGDQVWNNIHFEGFKEIGITNDDVYKRATFMCEIRR